MMKKFSTTLIVLSFLFALAAIVIALAGTYTLKGRADNLAREVKENLAELDEETAEQPDLPEGYELNDDREPRAVSPEELGFTFLAPNEWGAFTLTYQPGGFKGSGTYAGVFENMNLNLIFEATDPTFVPARGGAWSDVLGYRKTDDGYEINFLNQTWDPVAGSLVQGEVATVNGSVLIVSAETDEGPVIFAGDEGVRFAIANFETGPLPGGVFMAGPDIGRDAFRAFLESLEFFAK